MLSVHDKVCCELGIAIYDLEDIANIDDIQAKLIIGEMNTENRGYARSLFIGMAESDGFVHPKETEIIDKLFN